MAEIYSLLFNNLEKFWGNNDQEIVVPSPEENFLYFQWVVEISVKVRIEALQTSQHQAEVEAAVAKSRCESLEKQLASKKNK